MMEIGNFEVYCVAATPVKKQVLRTWKERLSFSKDQLLFWNPFNKYKTVVEYVELVEDDKFLISGNSVFCNERTYDIIKKGNLPDMSIGYGRSGDIQSEVPHLRYISFTSKGTVKLNIDSKDTLSALFDDMRQFE